jgi:glycosyltransferase involved in cell wall biosynthesis
VVSFLQTHWPIFSTVLFFRPEYGVEFLLQALANLRQTYPQLGCIFLGSGERSIEARMTILKEGIGESVLLLGDVSHELCLSMMSRSNAFLRCTFADGDSISVREALELGVPVVASEVGFRPSGVFLYPAGDIDTFIMQVKSALGEGRKNEIVASQDTSRPRLIDLYRNLQPEDIGT